MLKNYRKKIKRKSEKKTEPDEEKYPAETPANTPEKYPIFDKYSRENYVRPEKTPLCTHDFVRISGSIVCTKCDIKSISQLTATN